MWTASPPSAIALIALLSVAVAAGSILVARPPAAASPTTASPATASPATASPATASPAAGALEITEIMYHAPDGDEHDWIELANVSGAEVDASGFQIDGIGLTLEPDTRIAPGARMVVVADRDTFVARFPDVDPTAILAEFDGRLADGGERLTVLDAGGAEVFSARYDDGAHWPVLADGLGHSIEYAGAFSTSGIATTPDHPLAWRASAEPGGTPGREPEPMPREPIVLVNEIIAATDPPYEDAIELYNPNEVAVDLTGWFLSDGRDTIDDLRRFAIPGILVGSTVRFPVVPPFGYLVLYASDFSDPTVPGNFGLSADGEGAFLSAPDAAGTGVSMSRGAEFGPSETNRSYGRVVTSIGWDFARLDLPTFGIDAPMSVEEFRTGAGAENSNPAVGPLVIDELLVEPADGGPEFIELRNLTSEPIALWSTAALTSTFRLDDAISFSFGPGDVIPAGGRLVVAASEPAAFRAARAVPAEVPVVGPYAGSLNNAGEVLRLDRRLFDGDDRPGGWLPLERVDFEARPPWPPAAFGAGESLQRAAAFDRPGYANDPASWTSGGLGGSPGRPPGDPPPATPATPATATATPPTPTTPATPGTPATPLPCDCRIWLPRAAR